VIFRLAAAGGSALLLGCSKPPVAEAPAGPRPVKMFTVQQESSSLYREYPGTISAAQRAEMAFEVPGRIVEFPVREGTFVPEGEVLARLDPRDYEARKDTAKANLRKAQADFRRGKNIRNEDAGAISQAQLDGYRRSVEVAEAQLREAEKAYEDTVLRAPFAGYLARKLVEDFENVPAKQVVLILEDNSSLEIKVDIPERDVTQADRKQSNENFTARSKPVIVVSSLPDQAFPGTVKEFATTADPATRTFQATLVFDTPSGVTVLPGMTAKVVVRGADARRAEQVIWIPARGAVADANGDSYVWLIDSSSQVRRRAVRLGKLSGSEVEVLGGLEKGDQIAVSGVHHLVDGMAVRRYQR
jgi:RND family efflux transporter MFP subunit